MTANTIWSWCRQRNCALRFQAPHELAWDVVHCDYKYRPADNVSDWTENRTIMACIKVYHHGRRLHKA